VKIHFLTTITVLNVINVKVSIITRFIILKDLYLIGRSFSFSI